MAGTIDAKLAELGITVPQAAAPLANYIGFNVVGNLVIVSGQIPLVDGKVAVTGKLGDTVSIEDGQRAARICFVNLLAQLKAATGGDLDRVARVVRLGGFVACAPGFTQHPQVVNGASDLAVAVFGDKGKHARAAVGCPSLPGDAAVEVEGMFELAAPAAATRGRSTRSAARGAPARSAAKRATTRAAPRRAAAKAKPAPKAKAPAKGRGAKGKGRKA